MKLLAAKVMGLLLRPPKGNEKDLKEFHWVYDVKDVIDQILWPVLILVAAAGTIYAVVLGVNMARADSTEKREEAKKRVINVLIGMAIIIGLILLLKLFLEILPNFVNTDDPTADVVGGSGSGTGN